MEDDNAKPNQTKPEATPPPPMPSEPSSPPPKPSNLSSPPPQKSQAPPMPQSDAPREVSETAEPTDSPIAGADATFGDRAVAFLIDAAVAIALVIAGLILTFIVGFVSSTLGNLLGSVVNLVGLAYILTRDCLPQLDGLGVGKKVMKIRAVTMDGKPLTGNYEKGVIRNLPLIVAIVEVIVLIVRKDNHPLQRLGDDFAKTKVVKES